MDEQERMMQAFRQFVESTVVRRDVEGSLAVLTEDVLGVGMGNQGMVACKQQIAPLLALGKDNARACYAVTYENVNVRMYSNRFGNVVAIVKILCAVDGKTTQSSIIQSAAMHQEDGRWLLHMVQAVPVELNKESIAAYPLQFAENVIDELRTEVLDDVFDLISQSLSGGIVGLYGCPLEDGTEPSTSAPRCPLYFANDNIIDYLGYTRQAFFDAFGEDALQMVVAQDRDSVRQGIAQVVAQDKEFIQRFRLQKQDGSAIWVIQHARRTTDKKGRTIALSAITDVTQMMQLQECLEEQARQLEEQTAELEAQNTELLAQREALAEQAKALSISEERFRIALEKSSNIIFDYDVISGNIMHSSVPKKTLDFVSNISEAKENLVIGGTILDEYVTVFQAAFAAIEQGEHRAQCVVKVRLATGTEVWNKISLTGIRNHQGQTVRAVGLIEDITKQKEAEEAYMREEQYRQAILSDALAYFDINFSKDIFEECHIIDSRCDLASVGESYQTVLQRVSETHIAEKSKIRFINLFSYKNVTIAFERGEKELKMEYSLLNADGSNTWLEMTMRLLVDARNRAKKGFWYIRDIDKRKKDELELMAKSQSDPLTLLLNKGAAEAYICERLTTAEGILSGMFMLIDVDYFKTINDTYGHPFGDKILKDVANVLTKNFRETDVVGRFGGDEFCVFFCGMRSKSRVEEAAQAICNDIFEAFTAPPGKAGLSCSIGISACNGIAKPFESIYKEADAALYRVKNAGRNGYAFYDEEGYHKMLKRS